MHKIAFRGLLCASALWVATVAPTQPRGEPGWWAYQVRCASCHGVTAVAMARW